MARFFQQGILRSTALALAPAGGRRQVARAAVQKAIVVLPSGWRLRVARALVQNAIVVLLVVLLHLGLTHVQPTQADAPKVVTNCSSEDDFDQKLVGGGLVTFNCPGTSPIVITLALGSQAILAPTTVDGSNNGNPVTLSGNDTNRLFAINPGIALTLTNISLSDGNTGTESGGCIYNNAGIVLLDNVTMQNCRTLYYFAGATLTYGGGAILNLSGTLTVLSSRILSNTSYNGGGIESLGTLNILSSTIAYNDASRGRGGGLEVRGNVSISNSQIYLNRASDTQGGGIYGWSDSSVTIYNSLLAYNDALVSEFESHGGGIYSLGTLAITESTLRGNSAKAEGGGIFNGGTLTLTNVTLSGNAAHYGGGVWNTGTAALSNVTLSGNWARSWGGGILNGGTLTLTNSTLSGNWAFGGAGIYQTGTTGRPSTLKNTILANNPNDNCLVETLSRSTLTSNGNNLADNETCTDYFNQPSDWNSADPNLSPLGPHGGRTETHVPFPPSKAIDNGSACIATDQRGISRPQGIACDIGAVEYVAGETWPLRFLPIIMR